MVKDATFIVEAVKAWAQKNQKTKTVTSDEHFSVNIVYTHTQKKKSFPCVLILQGCVKKVGTKMVAFK